VAQKSTKTSKAGEGKRERETPRQTPDPPDDGRRKKTVESSSRSKRRKVEGARTAKGQSEG